MHIQCVSDSSSLLNPDADAFFPPAFPSPTIGGGGEDVAETGGDEDGEQIVVLDDEDNEEIEVVDVKPIVEKEVDDGHDLSKISTNQDEEEDEGVDGGDEDEEEDVIEKCNSSGASRGSTKSRGSTRGGDPNDGTESN